MDVYNMKQMWGALALRGGLSILFGIAAVFWPGITLTTLVYLFGGYIVANGLVNQVVGLTNFSGAGGSFWGRMLLLLLGALEVGLGVYLLRHPLVTFGTFILIIGFSLIARGVFELIAGIFGDDQGASRVVLIISGLFSGVVGIVLLAQPASGGLAFVWLLGLYALITGPMLLALAFEAKNAPPPIPAGKARVAR